MASTEDTNAAAEALESIQEGGAASGAATSNPRGNHPPTTAASVPLQQLASAASTQNVEADASKYDLKDLLDMKKEKSPIFSYLNFSELDPKHLIELFPIISGDLLPPKEMRTSSAHMMTWRRMSKDEQKKYKRKPDANVNWNTIDGPPAPPLSQPIDFLEGKLAHVKLFYSQVPPEDFDWTSTSLLKQTFPPHSHFGTLRPPMCLLLDAQSSQDKLTVINWWRFLTRQQQDEENTQLMDVYRQPSVSNDKLPPDFYDKMAELEAKRSNKMGKSTGYDPDPYVNWNSINGPPAPPLSQPVDYLEGKLGPIKLFYSQVPPEDFDWTSFPLLKQTFPPHSHFGRLRPPMGLLLDAQTSQDKLTVINWWRFLTKQQQGEVNKQLMDIYRRPTVSNDKLPPGFHEKMAELEAKHKAKTQPHEAKDDPNNNDWYMVRTKKDKPPPRERDMCCRGWSGEKFDVIFQKCYAEAVKSVTMKGGAKIFDSISVPESITESKHAKNLVFLREGDDYILRSVDCTKTRSTEGKKNSPFCLPCQNVKKSVHEIKTILLRPRKDQVEKQTELNKNLKNDLRRALRREKRLRTKLEGPKQNRRLDDESTDDEAPSPKRLRHGAPATFARRW